MWGGGGTGGIRRSRGSLGHHVRVVGIHVDFHVEWRTWWTRWPWTRPHRGSHDETRAMRTWTTWTVWWLVAVVIVAHAFAASNDTKFVELPVGHGGRDDGKDGLDSRGVGRIVGGAPAEPGRYPYMATLVTSDGRLVCGGTLISPSFVLSAAHCQGFATQVYVGRYFLNQQGDSQIFQIRNEIPWRNYDPRTEDGDYMLVRLRGSVRGNRFPRLATTEFSRQYRPNDVLHTIGWGAIFSGGPISNTLLEVEVDPVRQVQCRNIFSQFGYPITRRMICAGGLEDTDACQGDSGGPLFDKRVGPRRDIQLGITSWGIGCADGFPGVYARIGPVQNWITRRLNRAGEEPRFV